MSAIRTIRVPRLVGPVATPARAHWIGQQWGREVGEPANLWLAWDEQHLHVVVRNHFRGELPRDTDCVEVFLTHRECDNAIIRLSVNAAGDVITMASGGLAPQPRWGYWHFKPYALKADVSMRYFPDAWEAHVRIPFAELGVTAQPGMEIPLNLARGEHVDRFAYDHFGTSPGAAVRFWPLFERSSNAVSLFYPRLTLSPEPIEMSRKTAHPPITFEPAFEFQGLMFDRSRGALVYRREYLARFAKRLRSWGYKQFMIYMEGEFAPASHPKLRFADSYDAGDLRWLSEQLAEIGMELIPCHATLGHVNRILETPGYTHLQERSPAQICISQEESYALLRDVIDELSEAIPSPLFHACTDESLLLGYCECCEEQMKQVGGYDELLLRHLLWLREQCGRNGRRMIIWADMVLRQPKVLKSLPRDVILADWVYEDAGNYPSTEYLEQQGFEVLACPWNNHNNIRDFGRAARRQKLAGFLETSWTQGNKTIAEMWLCYFHASAAFTQDVDRDAMWKHFEQLLGDRSNDEPLPWELLAFAIAPDEHNRRSRRSLCRFFLQRLDTFAADGEYADILYELKRELMIASWRIALQLNDEQPPEIDELRALQEQERAFRREIVHEAATLDDPRIEQLIALWSAAS